MPFGNKAVRQQKLQSSTFISTEDHRCVDRAHSFHNVQLHEATQNQAIGPNHLTSTEQRHSIEVSHQSNHWAGKQLASQQL